MTGEQWVAAAIACGVCSALSVLIMAMVKKYDKEQKLRSVRLLIVFASASFSSFVVFLTGAFPLNHMPLQITATFTISALFHSWVMHMIEKGKKKAEAKVDSQ